jgi:hypothetical protein
MCLFSVESGSFLFYFYKFAVEVLKAEVKTNFSPERYF